MAKKPIEGSPAEEVAEGPAKEKAEQAKGDPFGSARGSLKSGFNTGAPKGSSVAAIKSGKGGQTKKRGKAKPR